MGRESAAAQMNVSAPTKLSDTKTSPVQWNLIANFASLIIVIGINIVSAPIYIGALGAESYGLIGFYALLTAGLQVFDFGLSATMSRECACFRGGSLNAAALWRVLNGFEIIFMTVAFFIAVALIGLAPTIAAHWLKLHALPVSKVSQALNFLSLALSFQWVTGLYRGLLIGFEKQRLLASLDIIFAAGRFFGGLAAVSLFGAAVEVFFAIQAIVTLVELVAFAWLSRRTMPVGREILSKAVMLELKRTLKFASAIGLVTVCWIALTLGDRFILSNVLTLQEFGVFTLAVTASSTLLNLSTPLGQVLLPRLTVLSAQGEHNAALKLYRDGTQLAAVAALPAALVLALFSKQILWIWTGDSVLAGRAAPILSAYALGSGIVPLNAFSYYLQYSRGRLRLNMVGNVLEMVIFLPGAFFIARWYGPAALGWFWTTSNVIFLIFWTAVVHHKFLPGLHWSWVSKDIGAIVVPTALVGALLQLVWQWPDDRLTAFVELVLISALVLSTATASSSAVRGWVGDRTQKLRRGQAPA